MFHVGFDVWETQFHVFRRSSCNDVEFHGELRIVVKFLEEFRFVLFGVLERFEVDSSKCVVVLTHFDQIEIVHFYSG